MAGKNFVTTTSVDLVGVAPGLGAARVAIRSRTLVEAGGDLVATAAVAHGRRSRDAAATTPANRPVRPSRRYE